MRSLDSLRGLDSLTGRGPASFTYRADADSASGEQALQLTDCTALDKGALDKEAKGCAHSPHLDHFPVDNVSGLLCHRQECAFCSKRKESIAFVAPAYALGQIQVCYRSKFGKVRA